MKTSIPEEERKIREKFEEIGNTLGAFLWIVKVLGEKGERMLFTDDWFMSYIRDFKVVINALPNLPLFEEKLKRFFDFYHAEIETRP